MTTPKVHPVRLQRSREKGARLVSPNGLPIVYVGRPSMWRNQYAITRKGLCWYVGTYFGKRFETLKYCHSDNEARLLAVRLFREDLLSGKSDLTLEQVRILLMNSNLSCWCRLGDPCHADTLLCVARGIYQ
jgi:hypothetical protein